MRLCRFRRRDPRQMKHVPGRDDEICVLRSYLRQRAMLETYASHHIQQMREALAALSDRRCKHTGETIARRSGELA